MNHVFIALGSNKGDTENNLRKALIQINSQCKLIKVSAFYATKAQNMAKGNDQEFLNSVAEISTDKNPDELLSFLLKIEEETGRIREKSKGYLARELDLDILIFNDLIIQSEKLTIPHAHLTKRIFVLAPLFEIAPDLIVTGTEKTVRYFYHILKAENHFKNYEFSV